jgi:mannose-1-phosphate guanylyltransferase
MLTEFFVDLFPQLWKMTTSSTEGEIKVVILVAGENRATRFRPLSLDVPKPLFPIAGKPMIAHHIEACKQLEKLEEIIILGSFEEQKFLSFINEMSQKHNLKIRL